MGDKATVTYILPSGAEVEIETVVERRAGASDVALARHEKIPFQQVIAPLGEVAELLFAQIRSSVKQPDSVTLEFSASLKGQTKLLIVSGEAEGIIKVSLTWKKDAKENESR